MPAKTVKDLIEFNKSVPDKFKVRVNLSGTYVRIAASFINNKGVTIYQQDDLRKLYYGQSFENLKIEKGTESAIERYEDPEDKPMFPWGMASCKSNNETHKYKCNNAWFISLTEVAKGYGPMLYDCLIAKLGEYGFGLTADRGMVSAPAAAVWSAYLTDRQDVKRKKLDLDKSTPPTEDDCYAKHSSLPAWNTWTVDPEKNPLDFRKKTKEEYEKEVEKRRIMRVAVNFAYFDDGITTLNDLKQAGLLIDDTFPLKESFAIKQLYESFLQDIRKPR